MRDDELIELLGEVRALNRKLIDHDGRLTALAANVQQATASGASAETIAGLIANVEANAKAGTDMIARLADVEQRIAAGRQHGGARLVESFGQRFTASESVRRVMTNRSGTSSPVSMGSDFRATVSTVNSSPSPAAAGAGNLVIPQHIPGIITPQLRRLTVRDLLMGGETTSNALDYVQETGYQNMSSVVAEGTLKPQSDIAFNRLSTPVVTIAHILVATKQILDDAPQLQSYIDGRMRYGMAYTEELELLTGSGVNGHLLGLIPQATAFNDAYRVAGDTSIDTLRRAILQQRVAEFPVSGIMLNPVDWAAIETLKDANGRYLWSNPQGMGTPVMWGVPVIDTNAIPQGHFLVGNFDLAAQIFDREAPNVLISTEDSTNFRQNLVTMRCEERLALAVYRPQSIVYGPFVKGS